MLLEIPTRCDIPAYEYAITLNNIPFHLGFEYSDRQDCWVMHIMDDLKQPIVMGIRVIGIYDLKARFKIDALPPGNFFIFDTANKLKDPGRDDFGSRVVLLYQEA